MTVNQEQVKSGLRWVITTFGGGIAGFFVAKGWSSAQTIIDVISSPVVLSVLSSMAIGAWGIIGKSAPNLVAIVNALPDVKGVVTMPTPEGAKLASESGAIGTVAPAGSIQASQMAK